MIRVGLVIPSFRDDAETGLAAASAAEQAGLDGVFVYDHLFPMGQPERPAISAFPLLAAVAASTERVAVGPLVARVGLVPDAVLVNQFATLARIAPGRVIAGLGTGDSQSRPEHEAFGLAFPPAAERLAAMERCGRMLLALGLTVWTSGRSPAAQAVAVELGVPHNVWKVVPPEADFEVTWAGPPGDVAQQLDQLEQAGVTWAVFAPPAAATWPDVVEMIAGGMGARR